MVAHKLMAIEVDWRREKETLLREIKRLRSEVGLMARRCNNSRKETHDMVTRLRTQPPPPVPKRPADIWEQRMDDSGGMVVIVVEDVEREVKKREEQGEKNMPMPEPTPESVPEFEPESEHVPESEPDSHRSLPEHLPPTRSPIQAPPGPEKHEERCRLSEGRMVEFGAITADGGGVAVDICAERWMLVWIKFCMHLAENGKDGETIYGEYEGEQKWDDQVVKWWSGKKDDLRNEMTLDENMSELINVTEVDKVDRMCWKMKFVKGFNISLEGNDMVLRAEEL